MALLPFISIFFRFSQHTVKTKITIIQDQYPSTMKISYMHNEKYKMNSLQFSSIRCIVYVRRRIGRFGNRMFIVATAYGLARLHSCHLYILPPIAEEMKSVFIFDLSPFHLSPVAFRSIVKNASNPLKTIMRDIICQYIPELTRPNAISQGTMFEVKGHWQSYLHFANYADDIREKIFPAKQSVLETVSKLFINIYQKKFGLKPQFSLDSHQIFKKQLAQSNWTTWIGVHVRRQDFTSLKFSSTDEYLFFAIDYYTRRYSNANFIVASDDKSYCRKLFGHRPNIFLTPNSFSPGDDLIALSLCQHSIITGGTFGWWAGFLANGQVIHDKVYSSGCEKDEHYYPPWFRSNVTV